MPEITTGIRNRNYLNIKNNPSNPWQGSEGNDSRGHTIFKAPEWGLRAGVITLRTYWFSYGLRTILDIVSRWAPATDTIGSLRGAQHNDPTGYADFVARRMRFGAQDDLELFFPDKRLNNVKRLQALIEAMAEMENYSGFDVPDTEFIKALFLVEPDRAPAPSDQPTEPAATQPATPPPPPAMDPWGIGPELEAQLRQVSALDLIRLLRPVTIPTTPTTPQQPPAKPTNGSDQKVVTPEPEVRRALPVLRNLPAGSFELNDAILRRLMAIHAFPLIPGENMVFFGIRGAVPVTPEQQAFAPNALLKIAKLNGVNPRCTLGQWDVQARTVAVFPGSTVPTQRYVVGAVDRDGAGANQLFPGYYVFRKGRHHLNSPTEHEAFRQEGTRIYRRTADDADYEVTDRYEVGDPYDNLHAAFGEGMDGTYSSAGCQVVVGFPHCDKFPGPDRGPWAAFHKNAYAIGQDLFHYALLEAATVLEVAEDPNKPRPLELRCGSRAEALSADFAPFVKQIQMALGYSETEADGAFGAKSSGRVVDLQRQLGLAADGAVGLQTAAALKVENWPTV